MNEVLEDRQNGKHKKFRTIKRMDRNFSAQHYFLLNLLYSFLLNADKSDAILHDSEVKDAPILKSKHVGEYKSSYKNQPNNPIYQIRNKLFSTVNETIERLNENDRIFSINTPTGSGKTITSLNAALKILEKFKHDRILYCLPFTSVIDQNYCVFDEIRKFADMPDDSGILLKHHHLTDIHYQSIRDDQVAF